MAVHVVHCQPSDWDNADRPTSVKVYNVPAGTNPTGMDFVGAPVLEQTVLAAAIDANGNFDINVDDTWLGMSSANPDLLHIQFVGVGQTGRYLYEDIVLDRYSMPDTISYECSLQQSLSATQSWSANLVAHGEPLSLAGVEIRFGTYLQYEDSLSFQDVVTDADGVVQPDLPRSLVGKTYHWVQSISDPSDLYVFEETPNIVEALWPLDSATPMMNNVTAYLVQGENSIVVHCPAWLSDGGSLYLYDLDYYDLAPSVEVAPGQTSATISRLGLAPFELEIDTYATNSPFGSPWPHEHSDDPDAWGTKDQVFRIKPGVNDLGVFHLKNYPEKCFLVDHSRPELNKVGFTPRQVALVETMKDPVTPVTPSLGKLIRGGFSSRQAKTLLAFVQLPDDAIVLQHPDPYGDPEFALIYGPPRLQNAHVELPNPTLADEHGYYVGGSENVWIGARTNWRSGPDDANDTITYPATVRPYAYVTFAIPGAVQEARTWVQSVSPKPIRMKTLLRGGFTRAQAKLLMED